MKTVFSKQIKLAKEQTITSILLFCLFNSVFKVSWAFPYLSEHNLREACRREVAGVFLNLHHQQEAAERNKVLYKRKISELTERIKDDALEITKIEKQAKSEHYLAQPEGEINEVNSRHQAAIQSKEEIQTLLNNSLTLLESTKSELSKLKISLKEIFIFHVPQKLQELDPSSLDFLEPSYLQYANPCPTQRSSCPLSDQHKRILKSVLKKDIQTGCKAYSE